MIMTYLIYALLSLTYIVACPRFHECLELRSLFSHCKGGHLGLGHSNSAEFDELLNIQQVRHPLLDTDS